MIHEASIATPLRFADAFYPGFMAPAHMHAFQRASLDLFFDDQVNRQIVEAPVRHGKSVWHSVIVPAWYCCTFPDRLVLGASYGSSLSDVFSRQVAKLVRQAAPYYGLRLDPRWTRRDSFRWQNAEGGYDSVGAGGPVSGKGYHFIAADDLVKDDAAARSTTQRKSLSDWFAADLVSRREPGGKISLVMSRRHMSDLSGECLVANADLAQTEKWHSVKFQAIQEDGTALWPERYSLEFLQNVESELTSKGKGYMFSSLYQQNPRSDPEACAFPDDYFPPSIMYDTLPPDLPIKAHVVACDPSVGNNSKTGDFCGIADMRLDSQDKLWVDIHLRRLHLPDLYSLLASTIVESKCRAAIIETNGFQASVAIDVRNRLEKVGCRTPVYDFLSVTEKNTRIYQAMCEWLHVHAIRFKDNLGGRLCVDQLKEFPSGEHDDGPDTITMGLHLIREALGA
jgi:predicted phage terminase large subunit-like protein